MTKIITNDAPKGEVVCKAIGLQGPRRLFQNGQHIEGSEYFLALSANTAAIMPNAIEPRFTGVNRTGAALIVMSNPFTTTKYTDSR